MSEDEEKRRSSLSKFLSLLLRHNPGILGLQIDNEGWLNCTIEDLADKIKASKDRLEWVTVDAIQQVVDTDPKGRYEINDQHLIRATYGHSIRLNPLDFPDEVEDLPECVYYAGSNFELDTMFRLGLFPRERRDRQYLHLSVEMKDAYSVAKNYTRYPRLIKVHIPEAIKSGLKFKKVSKFIVVCEEVPPQFLEEIDLPEELQYLIHEKPQKFQKRQFHGGKHFSQGHHGRSQEEGKLTRREPGQHSDRRKTQPRKFQHRPKRFEKADSEAEDELQSDNQDFEDNDLADQFNEIDDIKKKAKSKSTIHFETDDDIEFKQE